MNRTLIWLTVVCSHALSACAGMDAQYEKAVASGQVPYCWQNPMDFYCHNSRTR